MTPQILIVDDDQTLRTALGRWIDKQGWTHLESAHAHDAMDLLASQRVDLALVDVRMPDVDGLTLAQQIINLNTDIPILLMTAFADLDTARQALNIGVYEYFTKPLDFKDLRVGIERALQHRKLAQENRAHRVKLEQEVAQRTQELTQINAQLQSEIEERKQMERQLVQFERLGALAEMSEGISHNLNNILTGILGPAQLIELQSEDEKILNETRVIQEAALRAADLVKRLAVSVRGESEALHAVDVEHTIQEAIKTAQPRWKDEAEAKGIQIKIETNLHPTPKILGTAAGLQNLILNLIFNAVDAMPKGGTLTLSTSATDQTVKIIASDTGIGMHEEAKRRVFEPFYTTKAEVGRGLGMSSAYASITRWGGDIDLESQPNKGTTATVHLPLWEHNAKTAQDNTVSTRAGNILIAEDERIVQSFLIRALSPHHHVDAVSNGQEALALFAKDTYDVVLIDLGMPNMPGDQVIKQMRQTDPNVSAILITGWQLSKDDPRYQAFDFHLQKPFDSVQKITTLVAQAIQAYDNKQANLQ